MIRFLSMCKLQEPPFKMSEPTMNIVVSQNVEDILALAPKPKMEKKLTQRPVKIHMLGEKKSKKQKKPPSAGIEVIETLEEGKQSNPEPAGYTSQEINNLVQKANASQFRYEELKSEPVKPTNLQDPSFQGPTEHLPKNEELMFPEMQGSGPSSAETEPDLEQLALQEYLFDASKPLHTHFVLPNQGKRSTCPVYFGSLENKHKVLDALFNEMHTKIQNQWGTLACDCGVVSILKLSQTPRNLNKVFLSCPKTRETQCGYFQWIHQPPKPNYVPKTATRSALKKRLNDMVQERLQKRPKVECEENILGFMFP